MGSLRTLIAGLILIHLVQALPLCAQTPGFQTPLRLFATCTGRLSALMEYQWLVQDPQSDLTEARRDQMADLLEAALSKGEEATAMDLRLQAKVAEAQLLHRALFGSPDQAAWAWSLAQRQVADCTALLLS